MNDSGSERSLQIAIRLKEGRSLSGLSQNQVAKMMGLHRPTISEIESGNRKVSAEELETLCEIYDISLDWVLGRSPSTIEANDPRLELAARELLKLKPDDLSRLLKVIAAVRTDSHTKKGRGS